MRWPNVLRGRNPDAETGHRGWKLGRVALLGAGGFGLALLVVNAITKPVAPPPEEKKATAAPSSPWTAKVMTGYRRMDPPAPAPDPQPEPAKAVVTVAAEAAATAQPTPLQPPQTRPEPPPLPAALLAAGTGPIGVWSGETIDGRDVARTATTVAVNGVTMTDQSAPMDAEAMDAPPAVQQQGLVAGAPDTGCTIPAGTVVQAQLVTAASSDAGGAVIARVARDILGVDGCRGIAAGSTLVGEIGEARDFAQERGKVVFEALYTLDGRQIDLAAAAAGDAMGRGGVPGEAHLHTGAKALRVAVASAVDLAGAFLGSRGDGVSVLMNNSGRAVDEWARQALERKPSITLDPLRQPVTLSVIITRPLAL